MDPPTQENELQASDIQTSQPEITQNSNESIDTLKRDDIEQTSNSQKQDDTPEPIVKNDLPEVVPNGNTTKPLVEDKDDESKASSDTDSDVIDKNQMIEMFDQMVKESKQNLGLVSQSDSSEAAKSDNEVEKLDQIISSDPKDLILTNGHVEVYKSDENNNQNDDLEAVNGVAEQHEQESENSRESVEQPDNPKVAEDVVNDDNDNEEVEDPNEQILPQPSHDIPQSEDKIDIEPLKDTSHPIKKSKSSGDDLIQQLMNKIKNSDAQAQNGLEMDNNEYDDEEQKQNYKDMLKNIFSTEKSKHIEEEELQEEPEEEDNQYENEPPIEVEKDNEKEPEPEIETPQCNCEGECKCPHVYRTELSNDILSYERFYPGRILGNTFTIINKTDKPMNISVDFSDEGLTKEEISNRLMEFYEVSSPEEIEQPYLKWSKQGHVNAEKEYECWFIEDPYKKTLVKSVEYQLKPYDSFEFIVVLKSPVIKQSTFLITNVRVINHTFKEEHRVFAFGSLDVPRL